MLPTYSVPSSVNFFGVLELRMGVEYFASLIILRAASTAGSPEVISDDAGSAFVFQNLRCSVVGRGDLPTGDRPDFVPPTLPTKRGSPESFPLPAASGSAEGSAVVSGNDSFSGSDSR